MAISRKLLCVVYGCIGLVALAGCWGNNIQLFQGFDILGGNIRFWQQTLANPASRSITVDILCLGLTAVVWMFLEARRLSMPGVWFWVLFGVFIAMGAAFPWFLIHREQVLAGNSRGEGVGSAGTLSAASVSFTVLLGILVLAYTVFALIRPGV